MGSAGDIEEKGGASEPLLVSSSSKGGLITLPFILAIEGLERAATYGVQPNMIIYLMGSYGLELATGSNLLFWWGAATNFAPILGAFLADTYVGRFRIIAFGSIFSLIGIMVLWLTAMIPGARPSCNNNTTTSKTCSSSPTQFQLLFLCSSFALMSIGAGGIRSSTAAFGADQIARNRDRNSSHETSMNPEKSGGVIGSFFTWYCIVLYVSVMFALTVPVYIQDHMGWKLGFGVPLGLMLLAILIFFSASSLYVKPKPKSSLLTGFAQVIVASWRNRRYEFPSHEQCSEIILYHVAQGSKLESPSEKLRFLNKACMIKDPQQDLTLEGRASNPWQLCTTDQVEEFKSLLNIFPIWSTGIIAGVSQSQGSFQVIQANSMDRRFLFPGFQIPAGSFGSFAFIVAVLWLTLYDRVITPFALKRETKPTILSTRARLGASLLLYMLALVASAIVESVRRKLSNNHLIISAMWLVPQVCILGLAESLNGVAQIELYYSELPKSMSSIASSLYLLGLAVASLVASLIVSVVDVVTKQGGNESWISSDLNKGHYDYYYWVLAGLGLLNYIYFLLCSRAYWEGKKVSGESK